MSRAPLVLAASSIALLSFSTPARAQVCGGPDGYPPPKFSTLIDLPYLFLKIQEYTLFPDKMYTSPWTNWYRETDMRKALGKLAAMRGILEDGNLWDTYRFSQPVGPVCSSAASRTRQIDGT